MKNPKPEVTIICGDKSFTLRQGIGPGAIWIERKDGEGGDFSASQLYEHLAKFYDDNF